MTDTAEVNDITLASTTSSQAELDHATGPNWREHFDPPKVTEPAKTEETSGKTEESTQHDSKTAPASETGKAGVKEGETEAEKAGLSPGVQKKIDRLNAKLKQAETDLAAARGAKPAAAAAQTTTPAAKGTDPEPQLKDFKSWDEWNEARNRWVVRDEQRKTAATEHQTREQETQKQVFDSHLSRMDSYRDEHPEIDEKAESLDGFVFKTGGERANIAFQLAIVEADNGPAVLEYLADHPDEMDKFAEYSPVKVQLAIGRISAALSPSKSETKTTPTAPVSRTPSPTTTVRRSTSAPATRLDDPKLSTDEFVRLRNEQEAKERRH